MEIIIQPVIYSIRRSFIFSLTNQFKWFIQINQSLSIFSLSITVVYLHINYSKASNNFILSYSAYFSSILAMHISSLTALSQGKRRKIDKSEYSKLRVYNRAVKGHSTSRAGMAKDSPQFPLSIQQLYTTNQQLRKLNQALEQENQKLYSKVKKQVKLVKLLTQKYGSFNNHLDIEERELTQIQIQSLVELKLTIDVLRLEQKLQGKNRDFRNICERKKKKYDEGISQVLNIKKKHFIKSLESSHVSLKAIKQLFQTHYIKQQERADKVSRDWNQLKLRRKKYEKILSDLGIQIRLMNISCEARSKKSNRSSSDCFELENGQTRNQQDLRSSINSLKQAASFENQTMNELLQQKMVEKLRILGEIQEYMQVCKQFTKI